MTKEMYQEITDWQAEVFTQATAHSAAKHLQEEVEELIFDLAGGETERAKKEYADCFLLLFCSARRFGMTYEDICEAINAKMKINKERKWGTPNEHGYVKHVE